MSQYVFFTEIVPLSSTGTMEVASDSRPSKQTESEKFKKVFPQKDGLTLPVKKIQPMLGLVAFFQEKSLSTNSGGMVPIG